MADATRSAYSLVGLGWEVTRERAVVMPESSAGEKDQTIIGSLEANLFADAPDEAIGAG
jgi:hypothetical protein